LLKVSSVLAALGARSPATTVCRAALSSTATGIRTVTPPLVGTSTVSPAWWPLVPGGELAPADADGPVTGGLVTVGPVAVGLGAGLPGAEWLVKPPMTSTTTNEAACASTGAASFLRSGMAMADSLAYQNFGNCPPDKTQE
jgi:hypothetical protein